MKFLAVVVATCAFTQSALAQTSECRSLPDPGHRLACYDKVAPPPVAADKPAKRTNTAKGPGSKSDTDADPAAAASAEDALLDARIKNICRGC